MSDLKSKEFKTSIDYTHQDTKTIKANGHGFWVEDSRNKPTDLISKKVVQDALIEKISRLNAEGEKSINIAREFIRFKRYIDDMTPTADRPQGEWVQLDDEDNVYDIKGVKSWGTHYQCPYCGQIHILIENFGQWHYCPNCGADMRGGNK